MSVNGRTAFTNIKAWVVGLIFITSPHQLLTASQALTNSEPRAEGLIIHKPPLNLVWQQVPCGGGNTHFPSAPLHRPSKREASGN